MKMKKCVVILLVLSCVATACIAAVKEKMLLVRITDVAKEDNYQIMTPAEFKMLNRKIRKELTFFRKALTQAEKEWKADRTTKKKSFPKAAISSRKVKLLTTFTDMDKAQDKLETYEEKKALKLEQEMEREELKKKQRQKTVEKNEFAKSKLKKKEKKLLKKALERKVLYENARMIFKAKLEELMNPPAEERTP